MNELRRFIIVDRNEDRETTIFDTLEAMRAEIERWQEGGSAVDNLECYEIVQKFEVEERASIELVMVPMRSCLGNACTIAEDCKGCGIDASLDAKDV